MFAPLAGVPAAAALILFLAGVALILAAVLSARVPTPPGPAGARAARLPPASASGTPGAPRAWTEPDGSAVPGGTAPPYPARLTGRLDAPLSAWLWLVKWFLAIPHWFLLFFLRISFLLMTVAAGFAILFTGR